MKWLIAGAFALVSLAARGDDLAQRIVERLGSYPIVRAEFTQERTMAALTKPMVSSGHMVLSREQGLVWQVEAPVKATLVFAADGSAAGGAQAEMARLIRSIMTADLNELRSVFDLQASGELDRWTIRLKPSSREVAQYIRSIELGGGRFLETIGIEETSGDRMTMRMRNFTVAP
jgi:hypothetical protein